MGSCRGAVDCTNRSRDRKGPERRSLVTGEKEQVDDGRRGERQPPRQGPNHRHARIKAAPWLERKTCSTIVRSGRYSRKA